MDARATKISLAKLLWALAILSAVVSADSRHDANAESSHNPLQKAPVSVDHPAEVTDRDDSPTDDATAALGEMDWRRATGAYESAYQQAAEGSREKLRATFGLAVSLHHLQPASASQINRAKSLYLEVVQSVEESHSQSPDTAGLAARSLLNLGRIEELSDYLNDKVDLDAAREFYHQCAQQYPQLATAGEAVLRAGATLIMRYDAPDFRDVKQGVALIEQRLTDVANEPLAGLMWQYLGDSYFMPLQDYSNMLRCYEQADRVGWVDPANSGATYWRAARVAELKLHNFDAAEKYYRKIILQTPTSGKAYEASLALAAMGKPVPISPLLGNLLNGETAVLGVKQKSDITNK